MRIYPLCIQFIIQCNELSFWLKLINIIRAKVAVLLFKKSNKIRLYQTSHNLTFWCIFRRQTLPIYSCSYVLFYACYYGLFQYILIQAITKSWSNHTITTERFSHYRFYHAMRVQNACFYKLTCVCSFYSPSKSFRVLYEHQNIS